MNFKPTKAIILAAGQGTRLQKYASDKPKGMLKIGEKTLLERQVYQFRQIGISNISIVRGFMGHQIEIPGITYFDNIEYSNTNMLVSLFEAKSIMDGDTIVSYADIMFSQKMLEKLICEEADIAVSVDVLWKKYWLMRYGIIEYDIESLMLNSKNMIVSIGKDVSSIENIDGRFVGLTKFTLNGLQMMTSIWEKYISLYWDKPWQVSGRPMRQAYMTDMLQALIDHNFLVRASINSNGWVEFDTDTDYENALSWLKTNELTSVLGVEI